MPKPVAAKQVYSAPPLSAVTPEELPNNTFETQGQYSINKSTYGHWPVYKKVQNTKISTEIKRVQGNVRLFAQELTRFINNGNVLPRNIRVNTLTGEVNIKGDHVAAICRVLDEKI